MTPRDRPLSCLAGFARPRERRSAPINPDCVTATVFEPQSDLEAGPATLAAGRIPASTVAKPFA